MSPFDTPGSRASARASRTIYLAKHTGPPAPPDPRHARNLQSCLVLSGGISSPRQRFLPWRLNARRVGPGATRRTVACRVHTMHFVCRGLLPWQRTANIECTSPQRGTTRRGATRCDAVRRGSTDTARRLERACGRVSPRLLSQAPRNGPCTPGHGRRRNFGRRALIFFEISLVNEAAVRR